MRPHLLTRLAWTGVMLSACASSARTLSPVAVPAPRPAAAERVDVAPPAPPALPAIVVASEKGLLGFGLDGDDERLISAGPIAHPRWRGTDSVVGLVPMDGSNMSTGARLEQISLYDGSRRVLAELPAVVCPNDPPADDQEGGLDLDVEAASDFEIGADGKFACLSMMDRNTNMASYDLKVIVDLDSGAVHRWFSMGAEECGLPHGVQAEEPRSDPCTSKEEQSPQPADFPFEFDEARGLVREKLADGKAERRVALRDYGIEQTSPSGRWQVLGGDPEEGDYLYRRLVLLDRQTGELFALPEEEGAWPAPLPTVGKRLRVPRPVASAALLEGEADVRWLGSTPETEVLVVRDLLVRPRRDIVSLHGEVAL